MGQQDQQEIKAHKVRQDNQERRVLQASLEFLANQVLLALLDLLETRVYWVQLVHQDSLGQRVHRDLKDKMVQQGLWGIRAHREQQGL